MAAINGVIFLSLSLHSQLFSHHYVIFGWMKDGILKVVLRSETLGMTFEGFGEMC
jgi:hypothetical protein